MPGDPAPFNKESHLPSSESHWQRLESCLQKLPKPALSSLSRQALHRREATGSQGTPPCPWADSLLCSTSTVTDTRAGNLKPLHLYYKGLCHSSNDRSFEIPELCQTISFVSQDKNFASHLAGLYVRGASGLLKIQYKESLADNLYFKTFHSPYV